MKFAFVIVIITQSYYRYYLLIKQLYIYLYIYIAYDVALPVVDLLLTLVNHQIIYADKFDTSGFLTFCFIIIMHRNFKSLCSPVSLKVTNR